MHKEEIQIEFVNNIEQLTDICTKAITIETIEDFKKKSLKLQIKRRC